ncbi:MAG: hypothetical protein A3I60_05785 [Sulfuricurvum sp. RIFCSPLOWO2_02_FULL_43_45]|nr:MAG: hypothetical protein A3I60_05785 [Sulfuricurvum sp. RIFCSPLOWO2_02_FULL_43_45]
MPTSNYFYKNNSDSIIVFVHGLNGGSNETWTNPNNHISWQSLVHNDERFKNYSIYNVSYNTTFFSNSLNLYELSENIKETLESDGVFKYKHIHFITHSQGGLLIKRMLISMKNSNSNLLENVNSVSFLATPSQGSSLANMTNYLPQNIMSSSIQDLKTNDYNTYLVSLNDEWQDFFKLKFRPSLKCWYETESVNGAMVVNRNESSSYCDKSIALQKNHINISKPANNNDDAYKQVMYHVQNAASSRYPNKNDVSKIYWMDFPYLKHPLKLDQKVVTTEKRLELINKGNETLFLDNITLMSGICFDLNGTGLKQRAWVLDSGIFNRNLQVDDKTIDSPFVHIKLLPNEHIYIKVKFDRYLTEKVKNTFSSNDFRDFSFPFLENDEINDSIKSQFIPYILTIKSTTGYSECINLDKM